MTKEIWINLPVKDLNESTAFFKSLGFSFNHKMDHTGMRCMIIGEQKLVVMLVPQEMFNGFTSNKSVDTSQGSEVLISISAESRDEVDQLAQKAEAAGGKVFGQPRENQGWMYGCGFSDPDGHRWNVLYMDYSRMPKQ